MKQVIIMAAYYRVSTNLSLYNVKSISSPRIIFLVEISNLCTSSCSTHVYSPTPQLGQAVHFLRSPSTRLHRVFTAALPFFFVIYQISSKNLQQLPDDQSRSHFRCRFHFDFDFDLDSHSHSHSHFQSHSPATSHFMFIFILILISTVKWVSKQRPGTLCDGAVTVRVLQNRSIFGSSDLSILRWLQLRTQLDPISRIGRARFVSACQTVNQSGIFPPLASCCCCRSKKGHNRTRWTRSARSREVQ